MEIQNGIATSKNGLEFSYKVKYILAIMNIVAMNPNINNHFDVKSENTS